MFCLCFQELERQKHTCTVLQHKQEELKEGIRQRDELIEVGLLLHSKKSFLLVWPQQVVIPPTPYKMLKPLCKLKRIHCSVGKGLIGPGLSLRPLPVIQSRLTCSSYSFPSLHYLLRFVSSHPVPLFCTSHFCISAFMYFHFFCLGFIKFSLFYSHPVLCHLVTVQHHSRKASECRLS